MSKSPVFKGTLRPKPNPRRTGPARFPGDLRRGPARGPLVSDQYRNFSIPDPFNAAKRWTFRRVVGAVGALFIPDRLGVGTDPLWSLHGQFRGQRPAAFRPVVVSGYEIEVPSFVAPVVQDAPLEAFRPERGHRWMPDTVVTDGHIMEADIWKMSQSAFRRFRELSSRYQVNAPVIGTPTLAVPPAPFTADYQTIYGPPPAPILSNYTQWVWQNGSWVQVIDHAAYNAAMQTYLQQLADYQLYEQAVRQHNEEQRLLEEQYERDQREYHEWEELQIGIKLANTAQWFIGFPEPTTQVHPDAARPVRRNDRKTDRFGYRRALSWINRTYGEVDEFFDLYNAWLTNNYLEVPQNARTDRPPEGMRYDTVSIDGVPSLVLRPVTLEAYTSIDSWEFDLGGFLADVIRNQVEDAFYGKLGEGNRSLSEATGRITGVQFGPAT
jgi:hypothetical protein